ncbi:MAG: transposase DNA-binding-containing protein [Candidatus Rhabdochlamydia sp.]
MQILRKEDTEDKNINIKTQCLDYDTASCNFKDKRLKERLQKILEQIWNGIGKTIPFACQDWANTKAAYRFLSNENVSEKEILDGHFIATKERVTAQKEGMILVLQDTTEFSYNSSNPEKIGWTTNLQIGKSMIGKPILYKKCGILMHSSLAITDAGLPLGLCAIKFWTRKQFKGSNELKKRINPTRIPIEEKESYRWLENLKQSTELLPDPARCIHIGDRERIIWKLVTDLPITRAEEAIEKLNWYSLRWKIETFHKILKSGCRAESIKLRTADRLSNLIAIFCIVSWRIFWMTMIARISPNAQPEVAFTKEELEVLDAVPNKSSDNMQNKTLYYYLNKVAKLGGYMNRALDPPPGNMVMWRGFSKLSDIRFGFNMAMKMTCG